MFGPKKTGDTNDTKVTNLNTASMWQRVANGAQNLYNAGQRGQQYTTGSGSSNSSPSTATGGGNNHLPLSPNSGGTRSYGTGK